MATDAETVVRQAYHAAEGKVLDIQGFVDLFAEDGVFRNVVAGDSYRGEHLGDMVAFMGQLAPDLHRELHKVTVLGNVVAVELSIQGTVSGQFPTPAGVVQATGAKLDIPTGDFWYVEDGKIKEFNCYVGISVMLAQLGVLPDFASAVAKFPAAA